jgi:hypothetical protein
MALPFLNRDQEQARLLAAISEVSPPRLAVVYGRRRCGKSTLLQRIRRPRDVYYVADERETLPQLASLAGEVARILHGFDAAQYPSWDAFLRSLNERSLPGMALILDEFPYLVHASPELPSLVQKYLDLPGQGHFHLVLCGSSQRMMHGLVLDATAPLYGRATAIQQVEPLTPGWISEAFPRLTPQQCVEAYAIWGGVPRYWEMATAHPDTMTAVRNLILDRNGVLHEEPMRLLLDDMRSATQPYSILSLIGEGCHRLSEIGARLGRPAVGISRPLALLIDLGYIAREIPFAESTKSTKRTLYRLQDPFFSFYFRFVRPQQTMLEIGLVDPVVEAISKHLGEHVSGIWEWLARWSVPHSNIANEKWGPASRWWGKLDGQQEEIDVVAASLNGKSILVGEAKWTAKVDPQREFARLRHLGAQLPFAKGRRIVPVLWTMTPAKNTSELTQSPEDVLPTLKL